jgi:hypothetical protein
MQLGDAGRANGGGKRASGSPLFRMMAARLALGRVRKVQVEGFK